VIFSSECPLLAHSGHPQLHCTCPLSGVKRTSTSAVELAHCMPALSQDQAAPPWRPPLYFDLARINLDSTTPAMMAPAITRIVVRSMFIDYPFYPWTKCIYTRPMGSQVAEGLE